MAPLIQKTGHRHLQEIRRGGPRDPVALPPGEHLKELTAGTQREVGALMATAALLTTAERQGRRGTDTPDEVSPVGTCRDGILSGPTKEGNADTC